MIRHCSSFRDSRRPAFTLVELLIAMTVTLLLMASLAKVFGTIGKSIQEGRAQVTMSSKLRGLSFRLRTDIGSRTASASPPLASASGQGYFMYHEGPLTESTFANYGAEPVRIRRSDKKRIGVGDADFFSPTVEKSSTYHRFGRIGDVDDYVAFTAEARGDDWFTGRVPRYLVDDSVSISSTGNDLEVDTLDEQIAAMEPTIIRSKFAEIIMWVSPVWETDPATRSLSLAAHPSAMPIYRDSDRNLIPDQFVLHQRILLIRPDLNSIESIPSVGSPNFESETLRPIPDQINPTAKRDMSDHSIAPVALSRIYPIGLNLTGTPPNSGTRNYSDLNPDYCRTETYDATGPDYRAFHESNWLVGMAPLHHFFDLSLRRLVHPITGEPTAYVACNSLSDLTQPHNRFGHVRYPGRYFGQSASTSKGPDGDRTTSMPLLATGWNDAILRWQGDNDPRWDTTVSQTMTPGAIPNWFTDRLTGGPDLRTRNLVHATNNAFGLFQGWLLPQFELGNPNPPPADDTSQTGTEPDTLGWYRRYLPEYDDRWDRTGQDIIATNVDAFDIRGFDPTAPIFATAGPDGRPGKDGVGDDGLPNIDQIDIVGGEAYSELGAVGSDDEVVGVNDLGIYDLISNATFDPENVAGVTPVPPANDTRSTQGIINRGDMVDLAYPYLAGSALGIRTTESLDTRATASLSVPMRRVRANYHLFMGSILSGHKVRTEYVNAQDDNTQGLRPGLQDAMKQSGKMLFGAAGQVVLFQPTYDTWTDFYETDGFDQSQTFNGNQATVANNIGTHWVLKSIDVMTRKIKNRIESMVPLQLALQDDTGLQVKGQPETSAPFPDNLDAISVTIRVTDPSTHESNEFSVVESLQ
jgi:type II secretory pathway pseudopilin PulG